ncbi:hypothetical protein ACFL5L_05325 [candidate division KSB1 bacterium]
MIVTESTVEFENIDDLIIFTRFNPKNEKSVPKGYELAEDVVNNKGGVLYAKDSEVDAVRIGRLQRIIENNPEMKPKFVLKRSELFEKIEREKIHSALNRLIESKKTRAEFNKMMKTLNNAVEARWKLMLTDPEIVLYISQLKFLEDKTKKTTIDPFYNHMVNTAIYAMGIMINIIQVTQEKFSAEDMAELLLVAMLHAAKGWESVGQHMDAPLEERKKKYIEANAENGKYLKKYGLSNDQLDAIDLCYQYSDGKLDLLELDTKPAKIAQMVSIARHFDERISGLWGSGITPREAVDNFYVLAQNNKAPKAVVDALAKGLKFSNLFDFYHELEVLNQACHRNSAKPYPMTGFKSPVLYVCQKYLKECKEIVASAKSITVFKEMGGLEEGSYGRCEGLSDKLVSFYEEHYHDIKEEVLEKAGSASKKNNKETNGTGPKDAGKDKKDPKKTDNAT